MGGPIVRTGTTPKFWENYDRIFSSGAKKSTTAKKEAGGKAEAKSAKKAPAKKAKAAAKKKK